MKLFNRILVYLIAAIAISCSGDPRLPSVDSELLDENSDFAFVVSNQSYSIDPVDILVEIDGELVVSDYFHVGTQHNFIEYPLSLPEGVHSVAITSEKGDAKLSTEFSLGETKTVVIFYHYNPDKRDGGDKHFSFDIYDKPVGFR